ncbi:unnamed protein product, partial [marine sediment metagenome]
FLYLRQAVWENKVKVQSPFMEEPGKAGTTNGGSLYNDPGLLQLRYINAGVYEGGGGCWLV